MSVPVSDPLWRRPALLASALAGLLVGMAAYGVRWTRDQVQAYEPSVATAAAAQEPSSEKSPLTTAPALVPETLVEEIEIVETNGQPGEAPVIAEPSPAARAPARAPRKAEPRPKQSPARAPRTKAAPAAEQPPPSPPTEVAEAIEPQPETVEPEPPKPSPTTLAEAIAEANASSEPQAKTQPTSASASAAAAEGYTPFDRDAARSALADAAKSANRCRSDEGPFGSARVAVTFAPNGQTTTAVIQGPPFAGTPVGSCIARTFREARISPFSGAPVTVRTSVTIF